MTEPRKPAGQPPEPAIKDLRIDAPPEAVARAVLAGGAPPKRKARPTPEAA